MDIVSFNRQAWDHEVEGGKNPWTIPVGPEVIAAARQGDWGVLLTPTIHVPRRWFPTPMQGAKILGLASGGGQQGPIFAAAGADVTIFDNSPRQLARDEEVAAREGLTIRTVQGDMADLSVFADASFDAIFHPVSNVFVPNVLPVWRECARVLKPGGRLLAGFSIPFIYCLHPENGVYTLRHKLPYSDVTSITPAERERLYGADTPLEFGHTLQDQLGGQLAAGLMLIDLYEDIDPSDPIADYFSQFMATLAVKR